MGIGRMDLKCPICGKNKLMDNDGVFECMACGAHETINKFSGRIWTLVPAPIGRIKVNEKKVKK